MSQSGLNRTGLRHGSGFSLTKPVFGQTGFDLLNRTETGSVCEKNTGLCSKRNNFFLSVYENSL